VRRSRRFSSVAILTGTQFFPHLISGPFHHGLVIVFSAAAIMSLTGALVSLMRGRQFYYDESAPAGAHGQTQALPPATATPPNGTAPGNGRALHTSPSSGARDHPRADPER
jgi:hypothetical protein